MATIDSIDKDIGILVADDYALTRDMIRSILKQHGFQNIVVAEDGKKAMERLRVDAIALVICDWNMPMMSGIEVLRAVRGDTRLKDLPFLMLTAEAYRENVKEAAEVGVTDYISKPFTAQVLIEKIVSAISSAPPPAAKKPAT